MRLLLLIPLTLVVVVPLTAFVPTTTVHRCTKKQPTELPALLGVGELLLIGVVGVALWGPQRALSSGISTATNVTQGFMEGLNEQQDEIRARNAKQMGEVDDDQQQLPPPSGGDQE